MSNTPLITVSGPPGSGTSTTAEILRNEFGFEHLSGGDIFRRMARERGMTLQELTEAAETDESIDKEVDEKLKKIAQDHAEGTRDTDTGLILESRLAGWHAESYADLKIWIDAPPETRLERTVGRDETPDELVSREESEASRYESYYGIDIRDLSIYDLSLNSGCLTVDEMADVLTVFVSHALSSEA